MEHKILQRKKRNNVTKNQLAVFCLLAVGILVRIFYLGGVPAGINQDEAYAAYEAYSMLHYGHDSYGYQNPVYFVAWGSGMNVLNSYLMMPFIAIFGMHDWVVRLPQVIVACISLGVFYKLLKMMFSEKIATIGLFLLVISPWHIMMARWGLESNLAPGFLLFGFYFFVKGIQNNKYYLLSAFMYGLSLYCYATVWEMLPFVLLAQVIYLAWKKELQINGYMIGFVAIMAVMALPLILFLLINVWVMEEIRTPLLSIPRLVEMRASEISLSHIGENFYNLYQILTKQNDNLIWNATEEFGLYYHFSLPFALIGMGHLIHGIREKKKISYEVFVLIQLAGAILAGCLIYVNINRINFIHLWVIVLIALGVYDVCHHFGKIAGCAVKAAYGISFLAFVIFYFTSYADTMADTFQDGLGETIEYAMKNSENIYITSGVSYSKVLYYSQYPVDEYMETVEYTNYPSAYLSAYSFGPFQFYTDCVDTETSGAYILHVDDISDKIAGYHKVFYAGDYGCVIVE